MKCSWPTLLVAACAAMALVVLVATLAWPQAERASGSAATTVAPRSVRGVPDGTRVLLIIQGNYRTLDTTIDSILRNLVMPNQPCDVVLSLDADPDDVSGPVLRKLAPYLVGAFYRHANDTRSRFASIEFAQTLKVFDGLADLKRYTHVMRTRADVYVALPFHFLTAHGIGGDAWGVYWRNFTGTLRRLRAAPSVTPETALRAWFFSAASTHFLPQMVMRTPSKMVWSPFNPYEFNERLLKAIKEAARTVASVDDVDACRAAVAHLSMQQHVIFVKGGLFTQFGRRNDIVVVTRRMMKELFDARINWQNTLGYANWKDPIAPEAIVRLSHFVAGMSMIDLISEQDAIISFTQKYYGLAALSRAPALSLFILRDRQLRPGDRVSVLEPPHWRTILTSFSENYRNTQWASHQFGCSPGYAPLVEGCYT